MTVVTSRGVASLVPDGFRSLNRWRANYNNNRKKKSESTKVLIENEDGDEGKEDDKKKKKKKKKPFFLFNFFKAEADQYKTWKLLFGLPIGAMMGYVIFLAIVTPMDLNEQTKKLLSSVLVCGVAAGFGMSVKVRCVCFLLIPVFLGKGGRTYMGTYAIAFLISGPINNIVDNVQDITRSMSCNAQLTANQTKIQADFKKQPLDNIFKEMQAEGYMLKATGDRVNRAFLPIRKEIRGEEEVAEMQERTREADRKSGAGIDRSAHIREETKSEPNDEEGKKIENKYKEKVKYECEDVFNKGIEACAKVFDDMKESCKDKVPSLFSGFVCEIFNVGFLCNIITPIAQAFGGECDADAMVKPSFGKMYKSSDDSITKMDDGFDVNLMYKVEQGKDGDYTAVEEMKSTTVHDFKQGRIKLDFVFTIIKRLMAFSFMLIILRAHKYRKSFCGDLKYDNNYITSYFKKIDARRKHKDKKVILPLKKLERKSYISPWSPKLLSVERSKLVKGTIMIAIRVGLSALVFFMSHVLYVVMDIIRKHSRVDFEQTGYNHVKVSVAGTGFMSQIVRLFILGINSTSELNEVSSNLECLPRPTVMSTKSYAYVFGMYFIIWLLVLVEAYAARLRQAIAGFFYRKRQKQRVIYLYNLVKKQRAFFIKTMIRTVKRKAKNKKLDSENGLGSKLLGIFGCSKCCHNRAVGSKCLVCSEKKKKNFICCESKDCKFVYCPECWHDLKKRCYACLPDEEFSSTDSNCSDDSENEGDDGEEAF